MEGEGSFIFHESNYLQSSFAAFQEMRIKMEFTDVVIKVRDRDFPAHLVILAARIPYFQKVSLTEDKKIPLNEIDPDCMEALINFAYEGKLKITSANVQQVFIAAVCLQLRQIQQICLSFFSSNGDLVTSPFLTVIPSDDYIHQNFDQFSSTKEFLLLPYFAVKEIFGGDNLKVTNEEKVFEALIKWIKLSVAERQHCLPYLLSEIRMNFLSPEYLVEKVAAEGLIKMSDQCKQIVEEAKNYHLLKKRLISHSFRTNPRLYFDASLTVTTNQSCSHSDSSTTVMENQSNMNSAACVVTTNQNSVGANGAVTVSSRNQNVTQGVAATVSVSSRNQNVKQGVSATVSVSSRNQNVKQGVSATVSVPSRNQNVAQGVATASMTTSQNAPATMKASTSTSTNGIEHGIYAFQSFTSVGTFVSYYDCRNGKWDNFPKNSRRDCVQHVVHVKDKLYVFFPMVIETFNLIMREWVNIGQIGFSIKGAGIASYGSIIYVFGGLNSCNSIQMFDTQQNKFLVEKREMKYPCHNMSVASASKKCIYLTGGYSTCCSSTFLKFHPITMIWTELKHMNCPRMDHDSAVLNEKVYVCGGRNSKAGFLSTVEVYDKLLDKWTFIQYPKVSRHSLSLVSWDKRLYVFGGTTEKENCITTVEIYDTETKLWSLGASVPSNGTRVTEDIPSHSLPLPLPNQEKFPAVIRGVVAESEE